MSAGVTFKNIQCVLLEDWDPIGVGDTPEGRDEYNSYVGLIFKILTHAPSILELENCLQKAEEEIGTTPNIVRNRKVAEKLMSLV